MGRADAGWGAPRRRLVPGWVALAGAFAALLAVIYLPWRQDQAFADVTFRTWTCAQAPAPGADWASPPHRCEPSVRDARLRLYQASSATEPDRQEPGSVVFERVSTASVDLSLELWLPSPAEEVLLHPAAHGEEQRSTFHGDASGRRWTSYWRPQRRSEFDIVVVPRDAG